MTSDSSSQTMTDEKLLEKGKEKIKENLSNWENLNSEEQGETAEMMVTYSFLKNADKISQGLIDIATSIVKGKCVRCNSPLGKGVCDLCDIYNRVQTRMENDSSKQSEEEI